MSYRSLEALAARAVEDAGLHIAPELVARRLLARATAAVAGGHDAAGLARVVEGTLRELLRAGVAPEELQGSPQPRIERLARIGTTYLAELRKRGLVDSSELLWRASGCLERQVLLCLSGFPRLPAAEREFLFALAAPGSIVHLPVGGGPLFEENRKALEEFRARGWNVEGPVPVAADLGIRLAGQWLEESHPPEASAQTSAVQTSAQTPAGSSAETRTQSAAQTSAPQTSAARTSEQSPAGQLLALAFPDLDSEVRGTLAAVKRLLGEGVPATRIAIVARNEQAYGPALLAVAEEYSLPLRALYQVPLSQTRFGAWLAELTEVLGGDFEFEATARLLAHPLVDALDAGVWQEARANRIAGAEAWARRVPALAVSWQARAARAEFTRQLLRMLERLAVRRNAVRWAREAIAFQTFVEELRALPDPEHEVDADAFNAEIGELLGVLSVPIAPGRGGVELHSPLSLFGARVDHLFVVGATEGSLPSPVRPDPLLDPFEREDLNDSGYSVETVAATARREELSFWAMLQSAGERLTISYPKLVGRSETLASPFLARLGVEPQTPPTAPVCSLPELRRSQLAGNYVEPTDTVLEHARFAHGVETAREGAEPPDGHDGLVAATFQPPKGGIGVSRLIDLASCPFKFFAGSLLRLAEPEEAATELESSLRGRLYHHSLHLAMEASRDSEDPRTAALAALEASFQAAEEELGLAAVLPSWQLERDQHLLTLRQAIAGEAFIAEGAQVRTLETEFDADWRGIAVRGRVDRIDSGPDGLTLVDYKSGSTISNLVKDSQGRAKVDVQLPVYREAAPRLAPGEDVTRTRYYSVTKAKELKVADAEEAELAGIADRALAAWREGAYPVDPDVQENVCRYCDFDLLCRRGPRLERKRSRT